MRTTYPLDSNLKSNLNEVVTVEQEDSCNGSQDPLSWKNFGD